MRRAQERALAARPYAERMRAVLAGLAGVGGAAASESEPHALLERREVRETAVIVVTPDRGLCGGLIANLQRHAGDIVLSPERRGDLSMIPVGKKAVDYFQRFRLPLPRGVRAPRGLPQPERHARNLAHCY